MKKTFAVLLLMSSLSIFAQKFDILGAMYVDEMIAIEGQVVVDVVNKSIKLSINGKEMIIEKLTFKKGDAGELKCYKESIERKQRIVFSPYKDKTGDRYKISHIMTYTVVQGFSRDRSEVKYYLKKI